MRCLSIIILFIQISLSAQKNYVVDSSFEDYQYLPTTYLGFTKDIHLVLPSWYRATGGTPDYYNIKCISDTTSLPHTFIPYSATISPCFSYQLPRTGNGVVGIGQSAFIPQDLQFIFHNFNEYPQTKLSEPMQKNHLYFVSFYVNKLNCSGLSLSNIGAYITINAVQDYSSPYPPDTAFTNFKYFITPQIVNKNGPINDTANWVKISGIYKSRGNEQWLTIGHFLKKDETMIADTVINNQAGVTYLIDDVSVYDYPGLIVPDTVCLGETLHCHASLKGPFQWFTSNGTLLSTDSIYSFKATTSQSYILQSSNNRKDTFQITVIEQSPYCYPNIFIPNAFSPSGINRSFKPIGNNVQELNMKIYNRWGQLLYENSGPNTEWNGYYKDFICPAGIYIYLISYRTFGDINNLKIEKGFVELLW